MSMTQTRVRCLCPGCPRIITVKTTYADIQAGTVRAVCRPHRNQLRTREQRRAVWVTSATDPESSPE